MKILSTLNKLYSVVKNNLYINYTVLYVGLK